MAHTFVGTTSASGVPGSNQVVLTMPTLQADDLIEVNLYLEKNSPYATITPPTGYTERTAYTNTTTNPDMRQHSFWKHAAGSDSGVNHTFNFSAAVDWREGTAGVFRGGSAAGDPTHLVGASAAGNSASPAATTLTPTVDHTLLIVGATAFQAQTSWTATTPLVKGVSTENAFTGYQLDFTPAGSTGARNTVSGSSGRWIAGMVSDVPAGGNSYTEAGNAVAGFLAAAADAAAWVDGGPGVWGGVSAGADVGTGAETGAAVIAFSSSGADAVQSAEAGAAVFGAESSGADSLATGYVETGAAIVGLVSTGAEQAAGIDAGAAIAGLNSVGVDVAAEIDTGAAIAGWVASGAEVFSGVNNYVEAGFAVCGWVAQAADQQASAETGAAVAGWQASAAEVQTMAVTGFAVVGWGASGAESTAASYTEAGSAAFGWVSTAVDMAGLFDGGAAAIGLVSTGVDVGSGVDLAAALFGLIASGGELASGVDAGNAVVGWVAAGDGVMLVPISAAPTLHPEPVHGHGRSVGQIGAITRGRVRKVR